jgi:hypothetical protein
VEQLISRLVGCSPYVCNPAAISQYGSPKTDVTPVKVSSVSISPDWLHARLVLEQRVPGRVYELRPSGTRGAGGEPLQTRLAAYTVNGLK